MARHANNVPHSRTAKKLAREYSAYKTNQRPNDRRTAKTERSAPWIRISSGLSPRGCVWRMRLNDAPLSVMLYEAVGTYRSLTRPMGNFKNWPAG
jgi:hypothetical protein